MDRRVIVDNATGIAGGLLLLTMALLFVFLPSDEPVPPTFRVDYQPTENLVQSSEVLDLAESFTDSFELDIDSERVYAIEFIVRFEDDIPSSLADDFQFRVVAPGNERLGEPLLVSTNPPDNAGPGSPYTANATELIIRQAVRTMPRDGPIPAVDINEDAANAKARVLEDLKTFEPGTWKLDAYLDVAGDCPAPNQDPNRSFSCTSETQNGTDDGNQVELISIKYTTMEVEVKQVVQE